MQAGQFIQQALSKHKVSDFDEAARLYREALRVEPDHPDALQLLGIVLSAQGKSRDGADLIRRAIDRNPARHDYYYNLARILDDLGDLESAENRYRQALALKLEDPRTRTNLGTVVRRLGRPAEAEAHHRSALAYRGDDPLCLNNLGNALRDQGRVLEALDCFERAIGQYPQYSLAHSNMLLTRQYEVGVTAEELATQHAEWQDRHAAQLKSFWTPHKNTADPDRPLRLGFVVAELADHPVGKLSIRGLEGLDQTQINLYFYCSNDSADGLRPRFESSGEWRCCGRLDDESLAIQIRQDAIDVLFDLSGHADGGRLLVFGRKPAPVQMSWLGYVGTTGLVAIDYILADAYHVLAEEKSHYRERVLRLPRCYACFDPPENAPAVGLSGWENSGQITFGGAHNPAKLNADVVRTWAEILHQVPESRLWLRYAGLDERSIRDRYFQSFASHGIDRSRLALSGRAAQAELMDWYGQLDIALDPFPYSGGVTTCESLWMGVPVVTLTGNTFAGRHATSYLENVGLNELITKDHTEYVQLAVWLAQNHSWRLGLRAVLRERVEATLCNGAKFAQEFLAVVRHAWREWCSREKK